MKPNLNLDTGCERHKYQFCPICPRQPQGTYSRHLSVEEVEKLCSGEYVFDTEVKDFLRRRRRDVFVLTPRMIRCLTGEHEPASTISDLYDDFAEVKVSICRHCRCLYAETP